MSDEICEVVITAPSAEWAAEHTRRLVEARLAACGHQFPIRSIYRWAGEIHHGTETRIALHTRLALVDDVTELTLHSHPYEVPCIIVQPIVDASADYRAWVVDSTTPKPAVLRSATESASDGPAAGSAAGLRCQCGEARNGDR